MPSTITPGVARWLTTDSCSSEGDKRPALCGLIGLPSTVYHSSAPAYLTVTSMPPGRGRVAAHRAALTGAHAAQRIKMQLVDNPDQAPLIRFSRRRENAVDFRLPCVAAPKARDCEPARTANILTWRYDHTRSAVGTRGEPKGGRSRIPATRTGAAVYSAARAARANTRRIDGGPSEVEQGASFDHS